ncbi:hypothetical protein [Thalassotalea ganghwensis]
MNVLAELLPPAHLVKSENTAKDRKQKPKQYKKIAKYSSDDQQDEQHNFGAAANVWDRVERRSGEDRRAKRQSRGRWHDSRTRKDRRKSEQGIFVKI